MSLTVELHDSVVAIAGKSRLRSAGSIRLEIAESCISGITPKCCRRATSTLCCCQGLSSRGQGPGLAVRGQGLKFQMLKHLLNNDINFLE